MKAQHTPTKKFTCSKCKVGFGRKDHMDNHFKRKKTCVEGDDTVPVCITTLFIDCQFCFKQIKTETTIDFMEKHLEICKVKETKGNITTINHTTINNTYNYIQLNSYHAPALSHLEYSKKLLMNRQQILKQLNFNPDVPENHNIIYHAETGTFRLYSDSAFITVPYDKLTIKLGTPLDKAQNYLLDASGMTGEDLKALTKELDDNYGELEIANARQYGQIIKDNTKIALKTISQIDYIKQLKRKKELEEEQETEVLE